MKLSYSVYEAKAKLSEILRRVKENQPVIITERGREIAKVIPFPREKDLATRIAELESRGVLRRANGRPGARLSTARSSTKRPGALKRFLNERE